MKSADNDVAIDCFAATCPIFQHSLSLCKVNQRLFHQILSYELLRFKVKLYKFLNELGLIRAELQSL